MGSVSDEDGSDQQSERCGSYSLSADVSESESSGDFCGRQYAGDPGPSGSLPSSPVSAAPGHTAAPTFSLAAGPMTSGMSEGRLLMWEGKTEKRGEVDLSGALLSVAILLFAYPVVLYLDGEAVLFIPLPRLRIEDLLCASGSDILHFFYN